MGSKLFDNIIELGKEARKGSARTAAPLASRSEKTDVNAYFGGKD